MARAWKIFETACNFLGFEACEILVGLAVVSFVWVCLRHYSQQEHLVDLRR